MTFSNHAAAATAGVACACLLAAAPSLQAAEFSLDSRIGAVTVFPDAAQVTREGEVAVTAGQHVVWLRGLPAAIVPASIRVAAEGQRDALTLGAVELARAPAEGAANDPRRAQLQTLRDNLNSVRDAIDALEAEKRAIAEFSRLSLESAARAGQAVDPAAARAAWRAVGEGVAAVNASLRAEMRKAEAIEREIRNLEAALGRPDRSAQPRYDLAIPIEAGAAQTARFEVSYRVNGARWTPTYDAALDTRGEGGARLDWTRRAQISQTTGEDWTEVALTLSTVRTAGGAAAPEVRAQPLTLAEPIMLMEMQRRQPATAMQASPAPMSADAERGKAAEIEARTELNAFSASFVAPQRVSVAGDGATRTIRLSGQSLQPALMARVAPAIEPRAYLAAAITWPEDAPLLAGEVTLSRDGVFIGRARLAQVAAGDSFELGFGADDAIKVERTPVRRRDNDPAGAGASRIQISDHRTVITNLHRRPMRISVVDRIPVSENTAISVEALPTNTAPTERQMTGPGDRRGVMAWTHDYAPGERREIRLGWRLRWPADRDLISAPSGG
jgi:uncharacterized protein (TIGR02231 family)